MSTVWSHKKLFLESQVPYALELGRSVWQEPAVPHGKAVQHCCAADRSAGLPGNWFALRSVPGGPKRTSVARPMVCHRAQRRYSLR